MIQNQPAAAIFVSNPPTRSLPAYHLDTMNHPEPSKRGTLSICRRIVSPWSDSVYQVRRITVRFGSSAAMLGDK
jgi:hypothetical protein